jgi:uncharacterized membrane protein YfhO
MNRISKLGEKPDVKRPWELLLAFVIPVGVAFAALVFLGIAPFGTKTFQILDLGQQYIYFFDYLQEAFLGDRSLLYSFSRTLGEEMLGLTAYYLSSPLNLLLLLFPKTQLETGLALLFLLKIGLSGLSMGFYLRYSLRSGRVGVVIFACAYALMSYIAAYGFNIMWLDGLIMLPLVIMGVEGFVRTGAWKMLVLTLAVTIVANFYIAYMICGFTFCYFLYYTFAFGKERGLTSIFLKTLRFLSYALLAGAMAAFAVMPVIYALTLGKWNQGIYATEETEIFYETMFSALDFVVKLLPTAYDSIETGLPFVCSSALVLLLLPLYYLCGQIPNREKISSLCLLGFLFFTMQIQFADILWHGGQQPNWLPHRQAFLFVFVVLILAARAYENLPQLKPSHCLRVLVGWLALLALLDQLGYEFIENVVTYALALILICVYAAFLFHLAQKPSRNLRAALALIVILELLLNFSSVMQSLDQESPFYQDMNYAEDMQPYLTIADKLRAQDDGFYRLEKNERRGINDSMAMETNGIVHFGTPYNTRSVALLNSLGYSAERFIVWYMGMTPVSDSLLGIKYILLSNTSLSGSATQSMFNLGFEKPEFRPYEYMFTEDIFDVYENPYALPLAFVANNAILDIPLRQEEPFGQMNRILEALLGEAALVFRESAPPTLELQNLEQLADYQGHKHYLNIVDEAGELSFTLEGKGLPLFMYLPSELLNMVVVSIDGVKAGTLFDARNISNSMVTIFYLGAPTAGEELTVTLRVPVPPTGEGAEALLAGIYFKNEQFFTLDMTLFAEKISRLQAQTAEIDKVSDTHLSMTVTAAAGELLFTSIPYETGWQARVDGEKTATVMAVDSLLTVPLTPGTHTVELRFWPWQVTAGLALSGLGVLIFALLLLLERRRRQRGSESSCEESGK